MIFLLPLLEEFGALFPACPAVLGKTRCPESGEKKGGGREGSRAARVQVAACLRSVLQPPQRWCLNLSVTFSRNTKL